MVNDKRMSGEVFIYGGRYSLHEIASIFRKAKKEGKTRISDLSDDRSPLAISVGPYTFYISDGYKFGIAKERSVDSIGEFEHVEFTNDEFEDYYSDIIFG